MALIMTLMIKSMVMIPGATVKRVKLRAFQQVKGSVATKIQKPKGQRLTQSNTDKAHQAPGTLIKSLV